MSSDEEEEVDYGWEEEEMYERRAAGKGETESRPARGDASRAARPRAAAAAAAAADAARHGAEVSPAAAR
jgi:hypothetical protein